MERAPRALLLKCFEAELLALGSTGCLAGESRINGSIVLLAITAFCSLNACYRPQYYTVACDPEPPSRSSIAWQITSEHPGMVRGRILTVGTGEPVNPGHNPGARLVPGADSWQQSGPNGEFRFSGVQGTYQLMVRGFGYMPATASITVPADSGIDALAALEKRRIAINEVCGTRQKR